MKQTRGLSIAWAILVLGFISYGLSIFFYVYAQRGLGADRISAFYAVAPFIGAALSLLIFRELPNVCFFCRAGNHGGGDIFCVGEPGTGVIICSA